MTQQSFLDVFFSPTSAVAAFGLLIGYMMRMVWLERKAFKALRAREAKLILPDSEDTRLLIAKARRAKAEFDRVEQLHDILAKQRLGKY